MVDSRGHGPACTSARRIEFECLSGADQVWKQINGPTDAAVLVVIPRSLSSARGLSDRVPVRVGLGARSAGRDLRLRGPRRAGSAPRLGWWSYLSASRTSLEHGADDAR